MSYTHKAEHFTIIRSLKCIQLHKLKCSLGFIYKVIKTRYDEGRKSYPSVRLIKLHKHYTDLDEMRREIFFLLDFSHCLFLSIKNLKASKITTLRMMKLPSSSSQKRRDTCPVGSGGPSYSLSVEIVLLDPTEQVSPPFY
jgi:hypothetical protein